MKHTELPFKHVRQRATDDSHDIMSPHTAGAIPVATCGRQSCDDGIVAANAAFIVKAANNHYKLVEALKALMYAPDESAEAYEFTTARELLDNLGE